MLKTLRKTNDWSLVQIFDNNQNKPLDIYGVLFDDNLRLYYWFDSYDHDINIIKIMEDNHFIDFCEEVTKNV